MNPNTQKEYTILVVGGAGFIGSHVCASLLDLGHTVLCLDNLSTGTTHNLRAFQDQDRFAFIFADCTTIDPAAMHVDLDLILHLASPASPPAYLAAPFETIEANTKGTTNLLDLARITGARFLYASTSEIYGDPHEHPQPEWYLGNVSTVGPRACYDEGKRLGETITMEYVRQYQVDARIVRIFNTYGPRMRADDGRMVPTFIAQALAGDHLTVHGTGRQTRSLCYVEDTVAGILRAASLPDLAGQVINIGNPTEQSVMEWAQTIIRLTGSPSAIWQGLPRIEDDPERRCPDITLARNLLGWEPQVTPEDGLARTIAWARSRQVSLLESVSD